MSVSPEQGPDQCMIGMDLGGTKVTAGLVSPEGIILARHRQLLSCAKDDAATLGEIQNCLSLLLDAAGQAGHEVHSIGLGIPAIADGQPGQCSTTCCPNLPLLERCDLRQVLQGQFSLPVEMANDANCFVLGEYWAGEGQKVKDLVGLTLGTGIGCGMILDGRLRLGHRGMCGEIWDVPLAGGEFLESRLCGAAIAQQAGCQDAKEAAEAARRGHEPAVTAWVSYGGCLGIVLAWLERVIDPELFVLGGSLSAAFDLFSPGLSASDLKVPVVCSKLGEDAALVGAAGLARQDKGKKCDEYY